MRFLNFFLLRISAVISFSCSHKLNIGLSFRLIFFSFNSWVFNDLRSGFNEMHGRFNGYRGEKNETAKTIQITVDSDFFTSPRLSNA